MEEKQILVRIRKRQIREKIIIGILLHVVAKMVNA